MALIDCPECDKQVSDRARACPHCGFPVAETIESGLADVTGHDRIRTARQRAAGDKLRSWGEGYVSGATSKDRGTFFVRHQRHLLMLAAVLIVGLQVFILFRAIYE